MWAGVATIDTAVPAYPSNHPTKACPRVHRSVECAGVKPLKMNAFLHPGRDYYAYRFPKIWTEQGLPQRVDFPWKREMA
jgi:hypothetical protein